MTETIQQVNEITTKGIKSPHKLILLSLYEIAYIGYRY